MSGRMNAIIGTVITAFIVFYLGTRFLFGPAMANDQPGDPMASWLSLAITSILLVLFLDWVNGMVGNAIKSALIIALSQIILVDIYYPLQGLRGWTAAGASIVVLLVGWLIAGTVYGKLSGGTKGGG